MDSSTPGSPVLHYLLKFAQTHVHWVSDAISYPWSLFRDALLRDMVSLVFTKGPSSRGYGFSSSHVWMWELDCKESWALKNWCFWTVMLEKTLESHPLNCKEIKPVNPKGNQPWIFIGRTDAEAEAPIIWPPDASWLTRKDPDTGKDRRQKEKRVAQDGRVRQHHLLYQHKFEQTSGDSEGQGSLVCCSPWGFKESDMT